MILGGILSLWSGAAPADEYESRAEMESGVFLDIPKTGMRSGNMFTVTTVLGKMSQSSKEYNGVLRESMGMKSWLLDQDLHLVISSIKFVQDDQTLRKGFSIGLQRSFR